MDPGFDDPVVELTAHEKVETAQSIASIPSIQISEFLDAKADVETMGIVGVRKIQRRMHHQLHQWLWLVAIALVFLTWNVVRVQDAVQYVNFPVNGKEILEQCRRNQQTPGPPQGFHTRETSDRFQPGTRPVLLRNGTIWTGRNKGLDIVHGDIYLEGGIVKQVGHVLGGLSSGVDIMDLNVRFCLPQSCILLMTVVQGAWVSPGSV